MSVEKMSYMKEVVHFQIVCDKCGKWIPPLFLPECATSAKSPHGWCSNEASQMRKEQEQYLQEFQKQALAAGWEAFNVAYLSKTVVMWGNDNNTLTWLCPKCVKESWLCGKVLKTIEFLVAPPEKTPEEPAPRGGYF